MFISLTLLLILNLYNQYRFVLIFVFYFVREQYILTSINNVMIIYQKVSKIYKFCVLNILFFNENVLE